MASLDSRQQSNEQFVDAVSDTNPSLERVQNDRVFVERFAMLYNSEVFSDIILRVGDERFFAHKFMLITCSEVFEAMLNVERWKEARQPEISLSEEDECEPVFGHFLKYIYTGIVDLTTDNVLPVLLLADKYSIPALQEACVEYMMRHIVESPDTNRTLSWCQYSRMTGNKLLAESCTKFILSNFDIVLKAADWAELTTTEIMEFLSSSDVIVNSEFQLWNELVRWFTSDNNIDNLDTNLKDIVPLLRFSMIPPKNLLEIEGSELCHEHREIFADKLNQAYRHHSLLFDQVPMESGAEKFRNYSSELYGLCSDMSLLNYPSIGKIESKISKTISVPLQFVSQGHPKKQKNAVNFEVQFWPKGYYTTFTLYGNHMGRQTDCTTLMIRRVNPSKPLPAMETTITLIIYGMKNGIKYVAFTYTKSHTFTQESNLLNEENVILLKNLTSDNSPYLINGNLDTKIFIKIQNVLEQRQE